MDKAEIDEQGRPVLFWGKADVRVCEPVKNQKNVYLLEVLVLLESYQKVARPGQFYLIRSENSSVQFGRPISVYSTSEGGEVNGKRPVKIQFMILEKGTGTKELCHLKPNDKIYLEGPLGNTFELLEGIEKDKLSPQICIVGGGIGVAPVANFASSLEENTYDFYASFKSYSYGLENIKPCRLTITTDDGSEGVKGMLPQALTADTIRLFGYKVIYACGPTPMLAYIQQICKETGIKCFLSMEKKMLCAVGACLGCTTKTTEGNKRVCKDGPVFDGDIIEFEKNTCKKREVLGENESPKLEVTVAGVKFRNPVIAASGTFGYGQNYRGFFDVNRLGGICSKGLTLNPKSGNEGERILEIAGGDINSIGLENPGVEHFIEEELPEMLKLDTVSIANLAGSDLESYVKGAELLDKTEIKAIELNISCPNVKAGGMAWGMEKEAAFECVSAVRKATTKPLIVKLSPNAPDLIGVALSCIEAGADALSLINTIQAIAIDIERVKPVFNNVKAGMCGPAVKPIALRMVYDLYAAIQKLPKEKRVPIIGLGGISKWEDAVEFIMAGANAIQVGTATFFNPAAMVEIVDGLKNFMKTHGYKSVDEMCGLVHQL